MTMFRRSSPAIWLIVFMLNGLTANYALSAPDVRLCDTKVSSIPTVPMDVIDCRVPNTPAYVFRTFQDQSGRSFQKNVPGAGIAMCNSSRQCVYKQEFIGNAPAGNYAISTGWYLGPTLSGATASYREGEGRGYDKPPYNDQNGGTHLPDITCMAGAFGTAYGCTLDDDVIPDEKLPEFLPLVDEQSIKSNGGNCENAPLCFDKLNNLKGINKKLFPR